jgi:hypothetical protein
MQNRVLWTIGNLDGCTPVYRLHVAFKISYMYKYITKLCRTQVEVIPNHVCQNVFDKNKAGIGNTSGLNLAAARTMTVQLTNCSFRVVAKVKA